MFTKLSEFEMKTQKNHSLTQESQTDRQNENTQHPSHKTGIHNSGSFSVQFLHIIPEIHYDNP